MSVWCNVELRIVSWLFIPVEILSFLITLWETLWEKHRFEGECSFHILRIQWGQEYTWIDRISMSANWVLNASTDQSPIDKYRNKEWIFLIADIPAGNLIFFILVIFASAERHAKAYTRPRRVRNYVRVLNQLRETGCLCINYSDVSCMRSSSFTSEIVYSSRFCNYCEWYSVSQRHVAVKDNGKISKMIK